MRLVKSAAVGALVTALGLSGGLLAKADADDRHHPPRIFALGHSWVVGAGPPRSSPDSTGT